MEQLKNLGKHYILPLLLFNWALFASFQSCNKEKKHTMDRERWEYNQYVLMDTITNTRIVQGKLYSENDVLRLNREELRASNNQLSKQIESVLNRRKTPLSGTSVRMEHDTIYVPLAVADSNCSFAYEDSCISAVLDNGFLAYSIKPIEITIIQYKDKDRVVAAATYSGCGEVKGISSIVIEKDKKRTNWKYGVGYVAGLLTAFLFK